MSDLRSQEKYENNRERQQRVETNGQEAGDILLYQGNKEHYSDEFLLKITIKKEKYERSNRF